MTYKLFIVDDERITREGITKMVDWHSLGIMITGTASNGKEALNLISNDPPDILLCDVRMPHMNGIELAKVIVKEYPKCKIIFLSGYTDKEYLKAAISLKVEDYIEKPVFKEELEKTIIGTIKKIQQENSPSLNVQGLKYTARMIRQEIAALLTTEEDGYIKAITKFYPLHFVWSEETRISAICIICRDSETGTSLVEKINEYADGLQSTDLYICQKDKQVLAVVLNTSNTKGIINLLSESDSILSVGISKIPTLKKIHKYYEKAEEYSRIAFFYDIHDRVLSDEQIANYPDRLPEEITKSIPENFEDSKKTFEQIRLIHSSDINNVKDYLYEFYLKMMKWTINDNTIKFEDFTELSLNEIENLILYGMREFGVLGNNQYDAKIKNTIHFIMWNYMNTNLSINMIAENIGLSPNYLSNLFKQETGTTINNFIIDIRISKTKNLLLNSDSRLYEIAKAVGITDPNYLSILFKNHCGMTPSQYRAAKGVNK